MTTAALRRWRASKVRARYSPMVNPGSPHATDAQARATIGRLCRGGAQAIVYATHVGSLGIWSGSGDSVSSARRGAVYEALAVCTRRLLK